MTATVAQLQRIMPRAPMAWLIPLPTTAARFGIDTPAEIASLVAHLAWESNEFTDLVENLNYSAQGLANTWARFSATGKRRGPPTEQALKLARRPEAIANVVYANRYGNGDEASGDGWAFRGRGPIQLTFRGNYAAMERASGHPLVMSPDYLLIPQIGLEVSCIFWRAHGLDRHDDDDDARAERRIINGGENGLGSVQAYLDKGLEVLAA